MPDRDQEGSLQLDDKDDSLMDALQLAEEIEAVAALLMRLAEDKPTPRVCSAARALRRSAHRLIVLIGRHLEDD